MREFTRVSADVREPGPPLQHERTTTALEDTVAQVPARPIRWTRPATWPREVVALAAYWLGSRMVMVALVRSGKTESTEEVDRLYRGWSEVLSSGTFPVNDVTWQYPPGAALWMLAPRLLPFLTYLQAFWLLMLLADAVAQCALLRVPLGRPGRSTSGAWLWALTLPLLLGLPYGRYDVAVTGLAVVSLLLLPARPRLAGALAGIGAMVKVWPALTVLGTPRGRTTRQAWTATAAAALGLLLVLAALFDHAFDFLHAQRARGVEIESLGGTAFQVARLFGWPGLVQHHYGSMEFIGPYVREASQLSLLLTAAAFGWLLLWRLRARRWTAATPYDAALSAVLLFTLTSRVISPQYLIWLIGLAAVCLSVRGTCQRPVALLLIPVVGLTTVDYPLFFQAAMVGGWRPTVVIVARNGLLLAAGLWSAGRLWRATVPSAARGRRPASEPAGPRPDADPVRSA
ncbi:glycosyltransferase 87 family protein [Kitasatospora sp. CB01950]|uniref:glycosyltransferase 87 family protein n=1 Tax=Kitasatospora sp. CB01950 TaxID=1703930 RepID=UPI000ACCBD06|nr:glycosyltransferase 87 family protein [Kitasatospora sp. CB01950]